MKRYFITNSNIMFSSRIAMKSNVLIDKLPTKLRKVHKLFDSKRSVSNVIVIDDFCSPTAITDKHNYTLEMLVQQIELNPFNLITHFKYDSRQRVILYSPTFPNLDTSHKFVDVDCKPTGKNYLRLPYAPIYKTGLPNLMETLIQVATIYGTRDMDLAILHKVANSDKIQVLSFSTKNLFKNIQNIVDSVYDFSPRSMLVIAADTRTLLQYYYNHTFEEAQQIAESYENEHDEVVKAKVITTNNSLTKSNTKQHAVLPSIATEEEQMILLGKV